MSGTVYNSLIKELESKSVKGYTHQYVDRELFKEILTDAEKMRAFVHLQSSITNFIAIVGDIDIQVDLQPKRRSKQCEK